MADDRIDKLLDAAVVLLLMGALIGSILILSFVNIPDKNQTLLAAIIGTVVGAGVTQFLNYRFGSSKGSQAKDDTIAAVVKKASE